MNFDKSIIGLYIYIYIFIYSMFAKFSENHKLITMSPVEYLNFKLL